LEPSKEPKELYQNYRVYPKFKKKYFWKTLKLSYGLAGISFLRVGDSGFFVFIL
jgi:hypothetical protein